MTTTGVSGRCLVFAFPFVVPVESLQLVRRNLSTRLAPHGTFGSEDNTAVVVDTSRSESGHSSRREDVTPGQSPPRQLLRSQPLMVANAGAAVVRAQHGGEAYTAPRRAYSRHAIAVAVHGELVRRERTTGPSDSLWQRHVRQLCPTKTWRVTHTSGVGPAFYTLLRALLRLDDGAMAP